MAALADYYERRATEYDSTSWEHPDSDPRVIQRVRESITALPVAGTLDIGCGTGYLSCWLPGALTLMDPSPTMLSIARGRVPASRLVRSAAPRLPFTNGSFGRAFAANLYGHLNRPERSELVSEMHRVAGELIVVEQVAGSGHFREGPEQRRLVDGSLFTIHKCYFTVDRLIEELGGGDVLMDGPEFVIIRRPSET